MISASQRRPMAIERTRVARVAASIGRMACWFVEFGDKDLPGSPCWAPGPLDGDAIRMIAIIIAMVGIEVCAFGSNLAWPSNQLNLKARRLEPGPEQMLPHQICVAQTRSSGAALTQHLDDYGFDRPC